MISKGSSWIHHSHDFIDVLFPGFDWLWEQRNIVLQVCLALSARRSRRTCPSARLSLQNGIWRKEDCGLRHQLQTVIAIARQALVYLAFWLIFPRLKRPYELLLSGEKLRVVCFSLVSVFPSPPQVLSGSRVVPILQLNTEIRCGWSKLCSGCQKRYSRLEVTRKCRALLAASRFSLSSETCCEEVGVRLREGRGGEGEKPPWISKRGVLADWRRTHLQAFFLHRQLSKAFSFGELCSKPCCFVQRCFSCDSEHTEYFQNQYLPVTLLIRTWWIEGGGKREEKKYLSHLFLICFQIIGFQRL